MIRHVVLCRFKPGADVAAIFAALKALQSEIPGIRAISCGADCSPEGLQKGFGHGFTVDFDDAAARDRYLPHPAHAKVGQAIVAAAEGGRDGIVVLDWLVAGE